MPDPADVCPLLDGCLHSSDGGLRASDDNDGCPGSGGVPFATSCDGDERRFASIAREVLQRPKLTKLRVTSGVAGCADLVRRGLERAGVSLDRIEARDENRASTCERWAHFSIQTWDSHRCDDL